MKNYKPITLIFIVSIVLSVGYCQIESIRADEASNHIGEIKSVYGVVVSTNYNEEATNSPIFLNLDKAYPEHIFTVFIVSSSRDSFDCLPEVFYLNKKISVTGIISEFKGNPEIVVNSPSQIKLIL